MYDEEYVSPIWNQSVNLCVFAESADGREVRALSMLYQFPAEFYDEHFNTLHAFYEEEDAHKRAFQSRQQQQQKAQGQSPRQQEERFGATGRCSGVNGFVRSSQAGEKGADASASVVRMTWCPSRAHYCSVSYSIDYLL